MHCALQQDDLAQQGNCTAVTSRADGAWVVETLVSLSTACGKRGGVWCGFLSPGCSGVQELLQGYWVGQVAGKVKSKKTLTESRASEVLTSWSQELGKVKNFTRTSYGYRRMLIGCCMATLNPPANRVLPRLSLALCYPESGIRDGGWARPSHGEVGHNSLVP